MFGLRGSFFLLCFVFFPLALLISKQGGKTNKIYVEFCVLRMICCNFGKEDGYSWCRYQNKSYPMMFAQSTPLFDHWLAMLNLVNNNNIKLGSTTQTWPGDETNPTNKFTKTVPKHDAHHMLRRRQRDMHEFHLPSRRSSSRPSRCRTERRWVMR